MADLVTMRRDHIKWVIQQNPVTITIQRTTKTRSGGGFSQATNIVGPFVVRIFEQGMNRTPGEISAVAGVKQEDPGWGLLADYLADIQAGPLIKDEFDAPSLGHFVVKAVTPQLALGQVVGFQCDLERVS